MPPLIKSLWFYFRRENEVEGKTKSPVERITMSISFIVGLLTFTVMWKILQIMDIVLNCSELNKLRNLLNCQWNWKRVNSDFTLFLLDYIPPSIPPLFSTILAFLHCMSSVLVLYSSTSLKLKNSMSKLKNIWWAYIIFSFVIFNKLTFCG